MDTTKPIVELRAVSKRFGGTKALDTVDLDLRIGEVHALVGENGAGKSTLGKIIAGLYSPDSGELSIDGESVSRWDPVRAQRAGVVMIAQELSLVPELTVEQNVFLGAESNTLGVMHRDTGRRFAELEAQAGFNLPPRALVADMRIADQQKVEIMRALARNARVIVMDEPTSSLTAHETERLHSLIRALRTQGRTIVYVSHFLDAVREIADRITIMRDGIRVRTSDASDETKATMVQGMLGRELSVTFPPRRPATDRAIEPILVVDSISTSAGVDSVSLTVRPGEVVGLLGLVGSGRSEIARAIAGADPITAGRINYLGENRRHWNTRAAITSGVVMVPEDRHAQGLVLERSVKENISLAFLTKFSRGGVINGRAERASAQRFAEALSMRPPRINLEISGLSGGNQQKALLAKWLIGEPKFVIFDEPTRGVDIGAKATIYQLIADLADRGVGVLLISSEHEEVLALSSRAYTVSRGRIAGQVDPALLGVSDVLAHLFSVDQEIGNPV